MKWKKLPTVIDGLFSLKKKTPTKKCKVIQSVTELFLKKFSKWQCQKIEGLLGLEKFFFLTENIKKSKDPFKKSFLFERLHSAEKNPWRAMKFEDL